MPIADSLSAFAARLKVGQACEAGCGTPAAWAAVAQDQVRFACAAHLSQLLGHAVIWFVYPLELAKHDRAA